MIGCTRGGGELFAYAMNLFRMEVLLDHQLNVMDRLSVRTISSITLPFK